MWQHVYVWEKLRELERERPANHHMPEKPKRTRVAAGVMRMTGRLLRRMGEGLESWAAVPNPDRAGGRPTAAARGPLRR
jgi:hypothetical protein